MALKVVTAPAEEPVTLVEMKDYLRVDTSDDDGLLAGYITMARTYAEGVMGRAFVTQTWDWSFDSFPYGRGLLVPRPPLASVTSITYYDVDESGTVFASSNYQVDTDSQPGRVALADGKTWPTTALRALNGVVVRFVAGSTTATVSPTHQHAIKAIVAHFYEHREEFVTGTIVSKIPMHLESLLWYDRVMLEL